MRRIATTLCFIIVGCASGPDVETLFAVEHITTSQKLQAYLSPSELSPAISQCVDALYAINARIKLKGKFQDLSLGLTEYVIERNYTGNGFAVDSYGSIMTNAHVVNPQKLIEKAFKSIEPVTRADGTKDGYIIKAFDKVLFEYDVFDSGGKRYSSQYEVDMTFVLWLGHNKINVREMTMVNCGEEGRVTLRKVDDLADIAILTIPPERNRPYLKLGSMEDLKKGSELYKFSLRDVKADGETHTSNLEIKWGRLRNKCRWESIGKSAPGLMAELRMFTKFGDSGSPIVNQAGEVVAVTQAKSYTTSITYAVPVDYAQAFYNFSTGRVASKPKEICHCLEDVVQTSEAR